MTEEAKLNIITRKLHPFHQDRLREPLPKDLSELRTICQRMKSSNVLEKDLAFVKLKEISALEDVWILERLPPFWEVVGGRLCKTRKCTVADGQVCKSIGKCQVPSNVRERVKLVEVVSSLYHNLISGINFWKAMGTVPDLRHNEWYLSNGSYHLDAVDHFVLTTMEEVRLKP
ncbi:hypothetical protein JTB14_023921 [Gonioctena quinquepunctata]|nr:hypothetical protein JTB14_023921 [Gonioctena quinquepunctata]